MGARNVTPSRPVIERFRDEEYVNWLKAGLALLCTTEGLYSFCENPLRQYHQHLNSTHPRPPCSDPCGGTPCGSCVAWQQAWCTDIKNHLTPRHDGGIPCWSNTDKARWDTDYWQVAKVFMARGKDPSCAGPADTDTIGLLQLIINCKLFDVLITADRQSVKDVRKIRDNLFLSANFKISKRDLKSHIDTMVKLLEDPVQLILDTAAKDAVRRLKMILKADINTVIGEYTERNLWKMKFEVLLTQQLATWKEVDNLVTFVGQHEGLMISFGGDIDRLKARMDSMERRTTTLQAQAHGHSEQIKENAAKSLELREATEITNVKDEVGAHDIQIATLEAANGPVETENIGELSLNPRELVSRLAGVPTDNPLKVITILHELRDPDLVDVVAAEVKCNKLFLTEMRALSWVLKQAKCPVTTLNLDGCQLDIDHVKLLCEGLAENKSIQSLSLNHNHVFGQDEAARMLGTALTAMTQMRHLSVRSCYLRDQTWRHIVDGIWCHQMEELNCQHNELTSGITERRTRHICTEMPHLVIRCQHSELTPGNSEETMRRLLTQRRHLVIHATFCDVPDESISCLCAEFGDRFPWC